MHLVGMLVCIYDSNVRVLAVNIHIFMDSRTIGGDLICISLSSVQVLNGRWLCCRCRWACWKKSDIRKEY